MANRRKSDTLTRGIVLLCCGLLATMAHAAPNFVVILGEGHGWSSLSVQMDDTVPESRNDFVRTPNFDALAKGGMRFANFYAASPRCTPSRAALFTGRSPAQLHMTFVNEGKRENGIAANGRVIPPFPRMELPPDAVTIGEWLQANGYATAHFGKWHVGRASPKEHGFAESDGATNNGGPEDVENPHPKELYGMTERGMDFMARQVKAGRPFYLQLSHYAARHGGHASSNASALVRTWGLHLDEREIGEAAADADLDIALGQLLQQIDALGIATNTFVFFTTDHGTPGRNPPFAGGKGTVSEGGLRVPFIARGPGVAAGVCARVRAIHQDLFPTVAALANIAEPLPREVEGGSLAGVLTGGGTGIVKRARGEFVVHFPHYDKDDIGPASAIYLGDHKLVHIYETGARKLFDLSKDPGERRDLAKELPKKANELDQRLTEYLTAVNAQMPRANPNYDPSKPPPAERRGGERGPKR